MGFFGKAAAASLALAQLVLGVELVINDTQSTKAAASTIAYGMVKYYHGNETGQTPGLLGEPYYWWECGAMFNTLINYWYYTGDTTYNDIVKQGLLFQTGTDYNYMPSNESKNEGNDDQAFWGYAVMTAAELNFDNPSSGEPQWLALAQGVFNVQWSRWDPQHCGGGLRWQIYQWNAGYNYKNSASNGGLFHLASRLYAYTGNQTYGDYATRVWDWMHETVGLIGDKLEVYDGTQIADNCTRKDHTRWTYNQAVVLYGAAVMWNVTNSSEWYNRTQQLWESAKYFFNDQGIMFEVCEIPGSTTCNLDQQSFKAYLARSLAAATKVAPFLYDEVMPYLYTSATAAAQQCDGGSDGVTCGMKWTQNTTWDGSYGVGQQMAALEAIQSTLIQKATSPVSATTGGTSKGDPGGGIGSGPASGVSFRGITAADQAGAGILTAFLVIGTVSGSYWLVSE